MDTDKLNNTNYEIELDDIKVEEANLIENEEESEENKSGDSRNHLKLCKYAKSYLVSIVITLIVHILCVVILKYHYSGDDGGIVGFPFVFTGVTTLYYLIIIFVMITHPRIINSRYYLNNKKRYHHQYFPVLWTNITIATIFSIISTVLIFKSPLDSFSTKIYWLYTTTFYFTLVREIFVHICIVSVLRT